MALGKFVIEDEVFAPREVVTLEYKGPNPLGAYKALDDIARRLLEAKGTNTYEVDWRWDTTTDPRPFFINYFITKPFDKMSGFRVDFKFYGTQPTDPTKDGSLRLDVRAVVITKFEPAGILDNLFAKFFFASFMYIYQRAYYNKIRRRYIEYLRRRVGIMMNELRNSLKIPVRPT